MGNCAFGDLVLFRMIYWCSYEMCISNLKAVCDQAYNLKGRESEVSKFLILYYYILNEAELFLKASEDITKKFLLGNRVRSGQEPLNSCKVRF